ncbi:methyltransferase domain-containing protein [Candidatus Pelagibacter sp.]|nr:methyltransferase domain-containing protein [Candidatus Pelagibacter sp.]
MNYSFENYWKSIYQKRTKNNYETQSIQSKEIIDWHKKFIKDRVSKQFNSFKPRVLDVGCCSGYLTNLFCEFSSEVVGLDYQEGFIIDAKSKYSKPKFITGDIYNLNKINGTFDLIVCFGVLQNLGDLQLALTNIKSKLSSKKESKILFTTINYNSIFNGNHFGRNLTHPKETQEFSLNVYDEEKLDKFSKKCGLKLTRYEHMFVLPKFLGPLRLFARSILPSSFSHHVLVEMQHA